MTKSKKDLKKSVPDGVDPKSAPAEEAPANVAAVAKRWLGCRLNL